jgi:hypothetical protein
MRIRENDLKRVSNLIQTINDYYIEKKTWFNIADIFHVLMLNENIIDERILIKLRNRSLKFWRSWHVVRRCTWSSNIN